MRRVKDFAAFLDRSPDTAKPEDVRRYQLRLASSGAGTPKINAAASALRFFFNMTLERAGRLPIPPRLRTAFGRWPSDAACGARSGGDNRRIHFTYSDDGPASERTAHGLAAQGRSSSGCGRANCARSVSISGDNLRWAYTDFEAAADP